MTVGLLWHSLPIRCPRKKSPNRRLNRKQRRSKFASMLMPLRTAKTPHANETWEKCLDFTPPRDLSHLVQRREVQAKAEPRHL
eukprot:2944542-Amphidinium_carterae.1